ncbi:MAG: ATP-binding cassette domain-containing protein [Rhodospirillaceae bacterium]|nr:ATP-binding cassette domain-containing protein [Rhodospirillaceae bacterium]
MSTVLDIRNLNVRFATPDGEVSAVNDVSLSLAKGECLGIVGESGSGKSQTFMAAMGLLATNGRASGEILFRGTNVLTASESELNAIRGDRMSMIFQDPMTSLTPHMKIGRQLGEVLVRHRGMSEAEARVHSLAMLKRVHIPEAERRLDMYPHELSGGLRQRVMIAMALLCEPEAVIADEPTTALDVTVQAQILQLIREIKDSLHTAVILITHDLGVIAGLADRVAVMYAGRIVEVGDVRSIFADPRHPYTQGLLACTPRLDGAGEGKMITIPGQPPNLQRLPSGCAFHPRCVHVADRCKAESPKLELLSTARAKACFKDVKAA